MIRNFVRTAIRNLWKNRAYSFINIAGLSVGLASCLVIITFINNELSYDRFHYGADRIYRVGYEVSLGTGSKVIASSPHRLKTALETDFPDLEKVVHFSRIYEGEVQYKNLKFRESKIAFVDSSFFEFFNFEMIAGNPFTAVIAPNAVVISESTAKRYFGDEDPVGKNLLVEENFGAGDMALEVSGVIRDMPINSHFHIDFMISMATGVEYFPESMYRMWGWDSGYTYIRLPEGQDHDDFREELVHFGTSHIHGNWFINFFSQPITDIHLTSHLNSEIEANGDETYVYIFAAVALIIILLACVNYMNLATARASTRSREVGVRKVVGAQKMTLVAQFIGESLLVTLISFVLALGLAWLASPWLTSFSGRDFIQTFTNDRALLFSFIGLSLVVGLISGSYPAFYLSSFKPLIVIKGQIGGLKGSSVVRRGLVLLQFALSTALIIGTIVVYDQLNYLRNKKLGVNTERVLMLNLTSGVRQQFAAFKNELLQHSSVKNVSTSNKKIGRDINNGTFFKLENDGQMSEARLSMIWVDYDFMDVYGIDLIDGRNFSMDFVSDTLGAVILNQSALKALDVQSTEEVIGKNLRAWQDFSPQVVGVIEDIHFEQLYNVIKPMIFLLAPTGGMNWASISVEENADLSSLISFVENKWKQFEPNRDFRYGFLDDDLHQTYQAEENFLFIFTSFAGIAIFIACLGILGLASFTAAMRAREVGIRKVMGASSTSLTILLATDFLRLVILANIIAWPMAYFALEGWLQNFAYSTAIQWWVFAVAAILAVIIAISTVGYQALRAALRNPVDVLREE